MLVIGRNVDESIIINGNIKIMIVEVRKSGNPKVKLGIEAPKEISVHREEIQQAIDKENCQCQICVE